MTPQRRKDTYKLSPMQEGMLLHDQPAKDLGVDLGQIVCSMDEPIDIEKLKSAWRLVVDRHEALRTGLHVRNGEEPFQNIYREVTLPWNKKDLRALPGAEQANELNGWLREDRETPFELDRAPLFRLNLFRLGDDKWTLVWTFHHGILDSRSFPIVLTEVFRTYDAARRGEALDLPAVRPYSDYIQFLHSLDIPQTEKYWRKTLRGFDSTTALRTLEDAGRDEGFGEEEVQLSTTATQALAELAIRERFTVGNAVQAAWAVALSRYNDTADVVFGATRPCRGFLPRAGSMVGTFSNTLPVRVKIAGSLTVFELLRQIRASEIAVRDYEHTPLTQIQSWSELPPTSPLFESTVVFEHAPLNSQLKSPYLNWTNRKVHLSEDTNCPLTLYTYAEPALTLRLAYDRGRFGQSNIRRALGHLQTILQNIATGIDRNAGELRTLIEQPRREAVASRNETKTECLQNERIQERVEEQARPLSDAVVCIPAQIEPAVVAEPENTSVDEASPTQVNPVIDNLAADQDLWRFLCEKLPPVRVPSVSVPVDAVAVDAVPVNAVPVNAVPVDAVPVNTIPRKPVLKVEPNRASEPFAPSEPLAPPETFAPSEPIALAETFAPSEPFALAEPFAPPEPFAWATELPRSAKRPARATVSVKKRRAPHSVLDELLESAKGAARTTVAVSKRFAPQSVLREFCKSAKDAASTTVSASKRFAPHSVLGEFLNNDRLPKQPAEKLEARRPLRDSGLEGRGSAVVTIQPNGSKPPIFCISALDGDLNVFRTLSAGLGNDQPMYALEPSSLKNDPSMLMNVKKIARYYIDQLHAVGQDKPYCLVGYSFGGLVALEMSQQLRASGAEVPATVLIDAHYPAGCRGIEKLCDRMHRYKDHLLKRDSVHSSTPVPAVSSQATTEISTIQQRAWDRYRARPYPGRACIFKASTPLPLFDGGPKLGWDKIFNDNLSIYYEISGDNGVINTTKHAGLMVRRLTEFLGGVEESRVVPALSRIAS